MIDVIQSGDGFKVLILLPGIAKDDVKVSLRDGLLFFEITTRGRTYRRQIPLGLKPNGVRIRSKVENNSVVEIDFARGAEVVRR
jgi:HSP20 family molecular chaperone IbpA